MEEKKTKKISISTIFLILAIIVIIVMGIFMYNLYDEKSKETEKSSELQTQITALNETIDNLEEKINTISNMSSEINNSQSNNTTTNNETKFSNDEIKETLQNYLDLIGAREGSPVGMLVELGLCNYSDYDNATRTDDNYIKTNIEYSTYKEKMLEYVTEEWFDTNFKNNYKEQDGILYYFDGGATGMEFEVKDITIKGDYVAQAYIAEVYNINVDGSKELNNIEFHIANNNGKCVISYCD